MNKTTAFKAIAFLAFSALAACDNSQTETQAQAFSGDPTPEQLATLEAQTTLTSGFGTPDSAGTFANSLSTIFKGGYKDASGNGYAYELGRAGSNFTGYVGLLAGTSAGDLPLSGIATMRGVYQVAQVGKSVGDTRKYGVHEVIAGRIALRADFEYKTLQGSDEALIIDGSFAGPTLSGSAYFNKTQAALSGTVGGARAIGVFHGTDSASTFVGGFLVER